MKRKRPGLLGAVSGNIWFFLCLIAAGSCFALAVQLLLRIRPFDSPALPNRVFLGVPALFGGLAGLYGMIMAALAGRGRSLSAQLRARLQATQRASDELESIRLRQQARVEELSTLRELATVISQESDFGIIAEKMFELLGALLQPLESTIFVIQKGKLRPFAHCAGGKILGGKSAPARSIPEFDLSQFQSHSVVCRVDGDELHAIVPLKTEDKILGVLLLVFATDSRPPHEQQAEFNRTRRRVLLEFSQHISLAVKTKYLHTRAVVDALTQLYSRSHFNAQIAAAVDFAQRAEEPFSLALLDIDHFKKINDTYGHATGDVVLAKVAGRIRQVLRKYDTAYRYGGEEIAVLLPRTRMRQAVRIAERLRASVGGRKFRGAEGKLIGVTVSLGVAQFEPSDDPDVLFSRADKRLYRAKEQGRNRVIPAAA